MLEESDEMDVFSVFNEELLRLLHVGDRVAMFCRPLLLSYADVFLFIMVVPRLNLSRFSIFRTLSL